MKIKDERETQRKTKSKQRRKRRGGDRSYSEEVTAKWICCALS